jgi:hypothetical protein
MLGKAYVLKSNQYNLLLGFKIKSCNDGFSHGVVEFINDFELKSDQPFSNLLSYCESFDEALDVNSCIHGFGHLLYRSYVNGVISLSEAYDFCKFSDYKVYTLNCGTGISMSIMMDNFLSSNPYNNMCRERTSIENITCLLYPTISKVDDPISSQKPYCDYLNSKDEVSLCEMGVLNNFFVLHSPEQLYNYCLKISLARSSCLHNFMLTLPSVYGMAEFRKYEKLLNDHDYTKVTAKEILSFSSLELVDIFNRIEL